jgi:hypothetical protein
MELALEMDAIFIEGMGAFISSMIVFCGSVFLLLAMVLGARLAYLVTASVTLAFLFIMGLIWSFTNPLTPLGPVGDMPEWIPVDIAAEGEALDAPSIDAYQGADTEGGGWQPVDEDVDADVTQGGELASAASNVIEDEVEEGTFPEATTSNTANTDSVRFLDVDGERYGAVTVEPSADAVALPGQEPTPTVVFVGRYDPGNPLWEARKILIGTVVLLAVHLALLSASERKAKRVRQEAAPA